MRTELARGSTGKFPGILNCISWPSASVGSAVALSDCESEVYVTDAEGVAGDVGDGDISEFAFASVSEFGDGEDAAEGDAEDSDWEVSVKISAIDGTT
jgi:hypothetical protein